MGEVLIPIAAPVAILAFWVGMAAAAHVYPGGYDWRYQTISVLLYSDENPDGYLWAWAGLELCGLAGIASTAILRRRADTASPRPPATGLRVLQWGFVCMCFALLPDRLMPLPKGHEVFAILAFLGICIGVTCQPSAIADSRKPQRCGGALARTNTILRRVGSFVALVPLVLAALTQAYLALERPDLPWVGPSWRTRGISPFLSFGLWEWVSCAVLSMRLLALWNRPSLVS